MHNIPNHWGSNGVRGEHNDEEASSGGGQEAIGDQEEAVVDTPGVATVQKIVST